MSQLNLERWVVALRSRPGLSKSYKSIVQVNATDREDAKKKAVDKVAVGKFKHFNMNCFVFDTVEKAEEQNV